MELIMDNHEPKEMLQLLRVMNSQYELGLTIKIDHLEIADYICRNNTLVGTVAIERKEKDNFVSAVLNGQVFQQVMNMHANFNRVIVLVEGSLDDVYSKIEDHSKLGALGALITKYGTSIVQTKDMEWSAYLILSILKNANTTIDMSKIYRPKASKIDREIGAISCAEGWGSTLAKRALKYYRLRDLANIEEPKILADKIEKVGLIKARNLINLFSGFEKDKYFVSEIDVLKFEKYIQTIYKIYYEKSINLDPHFKIHYDKMNDIIKKYGFI